MNAPTIEMRLSITVNDRTYGITKVLDNSLLRHYVAGEKAAYLLQIDCAARELYDTSKRGTA
jgi:hypothetical protein